MDVSPITGQNFYLDLTSVSGFSEVFDPQTRLPAPEDWLIVVADVKNSTQAVAAGRYKNVNVIGAACIISVINKIGDQDIPFVFGGDGASFLIPPDYMRDASLALEETRMIAQEAFGLDVRLGAVPVHKLYALGKRLDVSKYRLPGGTDIAMFHGGGIKTAEELIKTDEGGGLYGLKEWLAGQTPRKPDFSGLECRWNPVAARKGKIITLMLLTRGTDETYKTALRDITEISGREQDTARPVLPENLNLSLRPKGIKSEHSLKTTGTGRMKSLRAAVQMLIGNMVAHCLFLCDLNAFGVNGRAYLSDVAMNSDFQKFDDTLRLVLDVPAEGLEKLQAYLEQGRARGEFYYGMDISDSATMTCLIFSRGNRHLHFIDGTDGGYTLAANRMKEQIEKTENPQP